MRAKLESLAAHLEGLDSESGDAKAIRWALAEIDSQNRKWECRDPDCEHGCASTVSKLKA